MALAVLLAWGGSASARSAGEPPPGIRAGRWVLAPYLYSTVGYDDNIFRANDCSEDAETPCASAVRRDVFGLAARLPVRNSLLELRYQADKRDYRTYNPSRPVEQVGTGRFQLNFGSGDQLAVSESYTRGASDVRAVDEGGEFEYQDAPYDLNRIELQWARIHPSRQGFVIRVARVDLNFVADQFVPFFDYRGFDSAFEYRQPTAGGKWLQVYYDSRRFNHYDPNDETAAGEPIRKAVGVPFRKEVADTLQVGFGGVAGHGKPFNFRAGYGRFRLEGTGAEFDGLVGTFNLGMMVGSRTRLALALWRRPLPSSFPTYYIVNSLQVGLERPFLREFMVGTILQYSRNQYGDPLPLPDDEDKIRRDQRFGLEGYVDWIAHPRLAVRLAAGYQHRDSNFEDTNFSAAAGSIGLRLGWF